MIGNSFHFIQSLWKSVEASIQQNCTISLLRIRLDYNNTLFNFPEMDCEPRLSTQNLFFDPDQHPDKTPKAFQELSQVFLLL